MRKQAGAFTHPFLHNETMDQKPVSLEQPETHLHVSHGKRSQHRIRETFLLCPSPTCLYKTRTSPLEYRNGQGAYKYRS